MPSVRTRDENVDILFRALRDPDNKILIPNIKHALNLAGYSDKEIMYYQMTGKHLKEDVDNLEKEINDFYKETHSEFDSLMKSADKLYDQARTVKKHRKHAVIAFIVAFIFGSMAVWFAIKTLSTPIKIKKSPVPAITESAPVESGDKL